MPPSMAKVKGEKLRTGWTTGACSAAGGDQTVSSSKQADAAQCGG